MNLTSPSRIKYANSLILIESVIDFPVSLSSDRRHEKEYQDNFPWFDII